MGIYAVYSMIFGRKIFSGWNRFLFNLSLRGLGLYNYKNLYLSGEIYLLNKILKNRKAPVIFDVGANRGSYSLEALKVNSDSRIYAFEPHPLMFKELAKNTKGLNVVTENKALSDVPGKARLYTGKDDIDVSHATLVDNIINDVLADDVERLEVDCDTIDDYVVKENVDRIDLLKIDVEGNELNVLKGSEKTIKCGKVDMIQFEFTQINSVARIFMKDFFDILGDDYIFFRLLPCGLLPMEKYLPTEHELFAYQNIVCVKKDMGGMHEYAD